MFKRVGGTVAVIVALTGSGFLLGQATADQEATAAAAAVNRAGSRAVVRELIKLNRATASIKSDVAELEDNVGSYSGDTGTIWRTLSETCEAVGGYPLTC